MDEEGRATLFKFGFVHLKSTISLSQSIFNIMHFQRTQFSLSLRWRVESNLKMRVGLECCLHKRARKWGWASMGSRSRNFYSDSDLYLLNPLHHRMHVRWTQFPRLCRLQMERWQQALNGACIQKRVALYLAWEGARWVWAWLGGATCKLKQYGSLRTSRKLAEKCQVKNSMEDGQCGDLEGSHRRNYQRLVSFLFPSIVK